jgi:diadenosine tetraphosphatase ApaH/serine/threonine PP2A family protein phosphatase
MRKRLSARSMAFLAGLEPQGERTGMAMSHGGPLDSVWSYILTPADAAAVFAIFQFDRWFFGHTHIQGAFYIDAGGSVGYVPGSSGVSLDTASGNKRFLLNPGSVGFPRDMEGETLAAAPACYAVYDTTTHRWQFRHALYDMRPTAALMQQAGLW